MFSWETKAAVGKTYMIRGQRHVCIAAGNDALLLMQISSKDDEPCFPKGTVLQYIIAHDPRFENHELVWGHGDYFPLFSYRNETWLPASAQGLREAVQLMTEKWTFPKVSNQGGEEA